MFSSDLPCWAQNGQEGIECFLSFVWHVPYVHLKFSFSVSDLHPPFVDEILFRQRLIASLEKFWISQAVNCRLSRKVVWNACLDGDLSYPGSWHHVKKSYLQMLGSNSKFNPNKLNGKSGKWHGIKRILPELLAKNICTKMYTSTMIRHNLKISCITWSHVCKVLSKGVKLN